MSRRARHPGTTLQTPLRAPRARPALEGDAPVTRNRVQWVDCCKGICILLVVYGHVAGGLQASGVLRPTSIFATLRDWVYLFHIPAFFFLSGLFARRLVASPFLPYLGGRLRVLFYPYLVWTGIILLCQLAMGSFVNTPASFSRALRCLWEPYGVGLWFLYSLFLISIYFWCLAHGRLKPASMLLVGVAGYVLFHYKVFGFWYILNESWGFAIYFLIGGCFPGIISAPIASARRSVVLGAGIGLLLAMTLLHAVPFDLAGLLRLVQALLGVAGVVCLSMALARTAALRVLAFMGAYSLEIYLAHPLWGTASRGILLRSGVHSVAAFVVAGVALGVAGSLTVALLCKRFHFPYLFRWPVAGRAGVDSRSVAAG
jgi:fucose 4-O-acetylase-like acetyltransferase